MEFSRQKALSQRAYIIIIRKHQGRLLASAPSPRGFLALASSKQQRRKIHYSPTHRLEVPSRDGRDSGHSGTPQLRSGFQDAEHSCHTAAGRNSSPSYSRDKGSTRFLALQEWKAPPHLYNSGGILPPLPSLPILGALTSKHKLLLLLIAFSHFFLKTKKQTEKKSSLPNPFQIFIS